MNSQNVLDLYKEVTSWYNVTYTIAQDGSVTETHPYVTATFQSVEHALISWKQTMLLSNEDATVWSAYDFQIVSHCLNDIIKKMCGDVS